MRLLDGFFGGELHLSADGTALLLIGVGHAPRLAALLGVLPEADEKILHAGNSGSEHGRQPEAPEERGVPGKAGDAGDPSRRRARRPSRRRHGYAGRRRRGIAASAGWPLARTSTIRSVEAASTGSVAKNAATAAPLLEAMPTRRHGQQRVVGEQRDDALDVDLRPRLLKAAHHYRLDVGAGGRAGPSERSLRVLAGDPVPRALQRAVDAGHAVVEEGPRPRRADQSSASRSTSLRAALAAATASLRQCQADGLGDIGPPSGSAAARLRLRGGRGRAAGARRSTPSRGRGGCSIIRSADVGRDAVEPGRNGRAGLEAGIACQARGASPAARRRRHAAIPAAGSSAGAAPIGAGMSARRRRARPAARCGDETRFLAVVAGLAAIGRYASRDRRRPAELGPGCGLWTPWDATERDEADPSAGQDLPVLLWPHADHDARTQREALVVCDELP